MMKSLTGATMMPDTSTSRLFEEMERNLEMTKSLSAVLDSPVPA